MLFFQTGFTHHGSHLVAVACMCRDARMGTLCLRPDWVHSARFSLGCGRVQGMQGLGVLALVVVAPCGFAAHVAPEEAVLSSPRNRCGNGICTNVKNTTQVAKFAPSLPPSPNLGPRGLGPRGLPSTLWKGLGPGPPAPFALFGTANQAPTLPLLWKALGLPPCPPGQLRWVPPHKASFKQRHFSSFCAR